MWNEPRSENSQFALGVKETWAALVKRWSQGEG